MESSAPDRGFRVWEALKTAHPHEGPGTDPRRAKEPNCDRLIDPGNACRSGVARWLKASAPGKQRKSHIALGFSRCQTPATAACASVGCSKT
jgi:hypothetical protein